MNNILYHESSIKNLPQFRPEKQWGPRSKIIAKEGGKLIGALLASSAALASLAAGVGIGAALAGYKAVASVPIVGSLAASLSALPPAWAIIGGVAVVVGSFALMAAFIYLAVQLFTLVNFKQEWSDQKTREEGKAINCFKNFHNGYAFEGDPDNSNLVCYDINSTSNLSDGSLCGISTGRDYFNGKIINKSELGNDGVFTILDEAEKDTFKDLGV